MIQIENIVSRLKEFQLKLSEKMFGKPNELNYKILSDLSGVKYYSLYRAYELNKINIETLIKLLNFYESHGFNPEYILNSNVGIYSGVRKITQTYPNKDELRSSIYATFKEKKELKTKLLSDIKEVIEKIID